MKSLALLTLCAPLLLGAGEVLTGEYRAVTIEVGQRKQFRVQKLESVTGSSGRCLEEGLDGDEPETIWMEASCSGVRTALVWKTDGTRVHVMACGEDAEKRSPELLKARQKVDKDLKGLKSVTACVRNGRVELWGWVKTETELNQIKALEKKYGLDVVRNFVEKLETEG